MVAHLLLCRNTLELWRTLGKDSIGICVLRRLSEKLKRVGDDSSEPSSSSRRLEDHQPSPESLTVRSVAGALRLLPHTKSEAKALGALCKCLWTLPGRCAGASPR